MLYPKTGDACPICDNRLQSAEPGNDACRIICPSCARVNITGSALAILPHQIANDKVKRALLSYTVRRMQRNERCAELDSDTVKSILSTQSLPSHPREMADNLLLWLGDELTQRSAPHFLVPVSPESHLAVIGAVYKPTLAFVIEHLTEAKQIRSEGGHASMTFLGWDRYAELKRGTYLSRTAFMAMKFGDKELDAIVQNHFVPAVEQTGFELRRLDENKRSGLIDDKLRVDIRASRFLIADLTHSNNGAYWEAGFAEGLEKPVIYTCRKDVFENSSTKPHFDTNHHLTILWTPESILVDVEELKATIRATLPGEAILGDR